MENPTTQSIFQPGTQRNLPNATAVLVLGILSIVGCFCYGIVGLVCGIIALVLAKKDIVAYRTTPEQFTISSYNNLKAGRICAIIGTIMAGVVIAIYLFLIVTVGTAILSSPDAWRHLN